MRGVDVHGSESGSEPGASGESGVDHAFLALERELAVFLRRARASSGEMAREVHPELEAAAYGLLVRLESAGRQRATDLAAYFGVGKATMSRQLRALEALGLVAREPDPADGRASSSTSPPGVWPATAASVTPDATAMCASSPTGTGPRWPNWPGCCIT